MNKERLKALLSEYGSVAIGTYFVIFGLVLAAFAVAISLGVEVEGATAQAGVLGAAYVATKLVQPLRIAATLALTPLVAKVLRRRKTPPAGASPSR